MSTQTLYVLAFILSVLIAVFFWVLAVIVFLKGKREFQNITLALALIFYSLFISSGFLEGMSTNGNDSFNLFLYQWSYAMGVLVLSSCFLFILSIYLGRTPKKSLLIGTLLIALPGVALSFSPWSITHAHYSKGISTSSNGTLYFIVPAITLFFCASCIVTAIAGRRKSKGIDRARLNIIFMGFMIFIPFPLIFSYMLPAITGDSNYTNYTFIASVIPLGLMAYTIIGLRLLDIRIILRKTGLLVTFLCVLAIPIVLLLIALSGLELSSSATKGLLSALFVLLLGVSPFLWKRMERYSSRL